MAEWIAHRLLPLLITRVVLKRKPDYIVGEDSVDGAYLLRWYLTPWRGWYRAIPPEQRTPWQRFAVAVSRCLPNLYLHHFLRDDDDRALHDHPSWGASLLLGGGYIEQIIAAGGIQHRHGYEAGSLRFMALRHAHRIELHRDPAGNPASCWTLFLFGPVVREWGFHCPQRGWVHWEDFTAPGKPGEVGRGCGE